MPMNTSLERNGELVKLPHGWGGWHLAILAEAMIAEGMPTTDQGDGSNYLWMGMFPNNCSYTFKLIHRFVDESDGEILVIQPGDIYHASR